MDISTRGLVLREVNYKEADKILTILTEDEGRITVSARGVRKSKSKNAASAQLLTFSDFNIYSRGGKWYLREGRTVEMFQGLRTDIVLLSLGSYFAELLDAVSDEDSQNSEILFLGLAALYILSKNKKSLELVKAAFELKLMCLAGYEPMLDYCPICLKDEVDTPVFDIHGGTIVCQDCSKQGEYVPLCAGSLAAMRYIVTAPREKVFAFTLGDDSLKRLCNMCERYLMSRMERSFRTLEFWKGIR